MANSSVDGAVFFIIRMYVGRRAGGDHRNDGEAMSSLCVGRLQDMNSAYVRLAHPMNTILPGSCL